MAKHRPHQMPVALSPTELKARIDRAGREGRYQQALELAKQLHKAEPTPANKQLLNNTYLSRARQLRGQGMVKDAVSVLDYAMGLGDATPAWLNEAAQELALCGDGQRAVALARQGGGDPELEAKLLGQSVDRAIQQEGKGRSLVPPQWQGDFDRVLQAFASVEAGQDEQARESLQTIGLRSPFLEWKVFLRGLIAFYQGDDARALENWQRLAPERLPARLAAPYRLTIDPTFRQSQKPQVQASLQKIADQLLTQGLVPQLRSIQKALSNEEQFPQAFRLAENVVPALRQGHPQALPRLAACFYWAIVMDGEPGDVPRYERVFGAPRDDPKFSRLRAMALEKFGEMADAHRAWQEYEKSIEENPANWPGEQANHARALIWVHMARNAVSVEDMDDEDQEIPPWLRPGPRRAPELHPTPVECLERSLRLAPDLLDAHTGLFLYHRDHKRPAQAEAAARKLLERFPDNVATLIDLGHLLQEREKHIEAVSIFERAVRVNPLDRRLHGLLRTANVFAARSHAEAEQFDLARASYRAALAIEVDSRDDWTVHCKWSACEFKAGDEARAEELLSKALEQNSNRLAVSFSMLIEVIRLKLPRKLKTRFDRQFKEGLGEPPTADSAVALAATIAIHQAAGITYTGQKSHEKQVIAYLERARMVALTQEQLMALCGVLTTMKAKRLLQHFIDLGKRKFPSNPFFLVCEATALLGQGNPRRWGWKIRQLLERALELARKLPADEKQKEFIKGIQEQLEIANQLNPFAQIFDRMPPGFFDPGAADEDEEDCENSDETW